MNNYFRITGYNQKRNYCFIMDCNGMFEQLWQFSKYILDKGMQVVEVSKNDNFLDGNVNRLEYDAEHIIARATAKGKPENVIHEVNGIKYKAVKVADKIYIPDITQIL